MKANIGMKKINKQKKLLKSKKMKIKMIKKKNKMNDLILS